MDLREHHRLANEGASVAQSVAPGDIVTEMEEGKSNRSTWKRERIAEAKAYSFCIHARRA